MVVRRLLVMLCLTLLAYSGWLDAVPSPSGQLKSCRQAKRDERHSWLSGKR